MVTAEISIDRVSEQDLREAEWLAMGGGREGWNG